MSSHMKTKKLKKAANGTEVKSTKPAPPASKPVIKPVVKKPVEKPSNIYGRNPATGKEEQMVMKAGKYAYASKKKGGATGSKKK